MSLLGSRRGSCSITCSYADSRTWRVAALNLVATAAKSSCELMESNVTKTKHCLQPVDVCENETKNIKKR